MLPLSTASTVYHVFTSDVNVHHRSCETHEETSAEKQTADSPFLLGSLTLLQEKLSPVTMEIVCTLRYGRRWSSISASQDVMKMLLVLHETRTTVQ